MGQVFSFPQKFTSRFSGKLSTAKNSLKLPTKEPSMLKTLGQGLKNNNLRSTTCTSVALNRQKHFLSESISFYPGPPEETWLINYYTKLVALSPEENHGIQETSSMTYKI